MLTGIWCAAAALVALWWPAPKVRYRLTQMAVNARPDQVGGMWLAGAVPVIGAMFIDPWVGVSATILAILVVWLRRRAFRRHRIEQESADLLAALAAITAELSIGTPPAAAFAQAGAELQGRDGAVAQTLTTLAARVTLGGAPGNLVGAQSSSIDPYWRRISLAWEIAHEFGVPIAELLESVRSDLQARRSFAARTEAGLAGPRATAAVLALLPLLGIALGQALGAQPIGILTGGGLGGVLLAVGTALGAFGLWWSLRIADHVAR